jgi:hypothetical protein
MAALAFGTLLKIVIAWIVSRKCIQSYDCTVDGDEHEPAKLRHGFGLRVDPSSKKISEPYRIEPTPVSPDGKAAWLYSFDRPRGRNRQHTLYGPYTNDFGYPRFARVVFRIAGEGFSDSDDPVIVLDVLRAPFGGEREHTMLGQKIVHTTTLRSRYKDFEIVCQVPGPGVYEYRATVIRTVDPDKELIFFKSIRVYPAFRPFGS